MSLVKLLPAWFHAIADYAVGILLIVVALAADGSAGATATGVVVGAVVLLVSALTRYPLGIVKVLPFTIHSAGDYLAAALLIVAPVRAELRRRRERPRGVLRGHGRRRARGEPRHELPVQPEAADDRAEPAPSPPEASVPRSRSPRRRRSDHPGPAAVRASPTCPFSAGSGNRLRSPMSLTTSVEPLEDNKVRLHVAIPADDFEQAIDAAFRKLAQEVKMPGFRPGKAPRRLLEARLGTEIARDQALRDSLPEYYAEAVVAEDIDVIAPPEIDITAGEEEGDVEFDAVVEVRPRSRSRATTRCGSRSSSPTSPTRRSTRQVDSLRERFADLEDSAAPLTDGDYAEIDIKGFVDDESIEGLTATDYLYEVGSGHRRAQARRGAARQAPRRHPQVHRHAARALRRARRRRGLVPGAREGHQEEGAARAHRRVGRARSASSRPSRTLRDDVRKRLDLYARVQARWLMRDKVFEAAAGARDRRRPRHAREQRDGASPPRPRAPARGAGDQA